MRTFAGGIAALILLTPIAAGAQKASIELRSPKDFSIKPADVPAGCKLLLLYGSKSEPDAEFTCDSKEQFESNVTVTGNLEATCVPKGAKVVCTVKKT